MGATIRQLFEPLQHGLVHSTADSIGFAGSSIVFEPDDWSVQRIAGVAERDYFYEECDLRQPLDIPIRDSRDATGEWIAIAASSKQRVAHLLFTDVHGYGTLFYSLVPGVGLVFAETFQGVIGALTSHGVDASVDWTNYIAALASNDQHLQGAFSTHTMASEVRLLGRDQALLVTPESANLINRSLLGGSLAEEDFSTALTRGIEHATTLIAKLSRQGMLNTLHLTGGVDSRLCLALIAAAGVSERFQARTVDPRTWKHPSTHAGIEHDVRIANELRQSFGMEWAPPNTHARISVSFEESIALKQTYRSSFLYDLNGGNQHGMASHRVAAVRGGGGELLRATHGSQRLSQQFTAARASAPDLEPANWRASRIARTSQVAPGIERHLKAAVRNSYRRVRSDAPLEGFEQHYLNYRNRSHFGHVRSSLMGNELAVHLLSNPWLLRAAQLTPIDSRATGNVVSEIFQRTAPALLDFPFESDAWTNRLSRNTMSIPAQGWQDSFDASNHQTRSDFFLAGHEHGARNAAWEFNGRAESIRAIKRNSRLLEVAAPDGLRKALMGHHQRLLEQVEEGGYPAAKALAASASAVDAIAPYRVSNFCAELGGEPPNSRWSANASRVGTERALWLS